MDASSPAPARRPPKRLLFDRRYGWIYDEWKDPSDEALAGGRGMFCILPIAKVLLKIASQSINVVAGLVVETVENCTRSPSQSSNVNASTWSQKLEDSER